MAAVLGFEEASVCSEDGLKSVVVGGGTWGGRLWEEPAPSRIHAFGSLAERDLLVDLQAFSIVRPVFAPKEITESSLSFRVIRVSSPSGPSWTGASVIFPDTR